jgi:hypothetical protein
MSVVEEISSTTPVNTLAIPKIVYSANGKTVHYEFPSLYDLVACLDSGAGKIKVMKQVSKAGTEDERHYLHMVMSYGNNPDGTVYFAGANDEIRKEEGSKGSTYYYDLTDKPDDLTKDRKEVYAGLMDHLRIPFRIYASGEYDGYTIYYHVPESSVKVRLPSDFKSSTVKTADGKPMTMKFDLDNHKKMRGKNMFKLDMPWFISDDQNKTVMCGCTPELLRTKFLSVQEEKEIGGEKASSKKRKEA